MNRLGKILVSLLMLLLAWEVSAQQEPADSTQFAPFAEDAPMFQGTKPRLYYIRKVNVRGVKYLNHDLIRASSGLVPGDSLYLPGSYISHAITRLWNQRYFSDVKVGATIDGDSVDIELLLQERPRIYSWDFRGEGISRSKANDLREKLALRPNTELSDYVIDRNEKLIKKEFIGKGFRNVDVRTEITNDTTIKNAVNVTFHIDRKARVKVGKITFTGDNGFKVSTDDQTPVSMNMWGFTPDYFRHSEEYFSEYLRNNISNPKAEFYIPHMVNQLITKGVARVKVLDTTSQWFGVTYAEDRAGVIEKLNALVAAGEYPERLF